MSANVYRWDLSVIDDLFCRWGWLGFNCGSTFGISGQKWKLAARYFFSNLLKFMFKSEKNSYSLGHLSFEKCTSKKLNNTISE